MNQQQQFTSLNAKQRQSLQLFVIRWEQLPPSLRRPMGRAHHELCCQTAFPDNWVHVMLVNFARTTLSPRPVGVWLCVANMSHSGEVEEEEQQSCWWIKNKCWKTTRFTHTRTRTHDRTNKVERNKTSNLIRLWPKITFVFVLILNRQQMRSGEKLKKKKTKNQNKSSRLTN